VMGPWAPVAGGLLGVSLGVLAVLLLAEFAESFEDRLALAFTVLGLGMLGASGALLADEVRMVRRGAREAAVRPAWVEATAGLLHGLTPARLLLVSGVVVLFLAAYVSRG
jgi:malonyl CoA-acyl carrier protein transacylase